MEDKQSELEKLLTDGASSARREPADKVRSIHGKYKRRLRMLVHVLDDFLNAAERKLDEGGKVKHRKKIEDIVSKARELGALMPSPDEVPYIKPLDDFFFDAIERAGDETERVLAEGREFFEGMTPEKWAAFVDDVDVETDDSDSAAQDPKLTGTR